MSDAEIARAVLIDARRRIENKQNSHICLAIDHVIYKHPLRANAGYRLKRWISWMLGEHVTYTGWAAANVPEFKRMNSASAYPKSRITRITRIAWIDWMLTQDLGEVMKKY